MVVFKEIRQNKASGQKIVTIPKEADLEPGEYVRIEKADIPTEINPDKFLVTTRVPYVDDPETRVKEMTREDLNDFFKGYQQFAEYIVSVIPLDS